MNWGKHIILILLGLFFLFLGGLLVHSWFFEGGGIFMNWLDKWVVVSCILVGVVLIVSRVIAIVKSEKSDGL